MIHINITQTESSKMSSWRISGVLPDSIVPEANGDWVVYVNVIPGGWTVVSYSGSSETIVKARGFGKAMTALADHFGMPVMVDRDHGVDFGKDVCQVYATTANLSKAAAQDAHLNKVEAQRAVEEAVFLAECDDEPMAGFDTPCSNMVKDRAVRRVPILGSKRKASLNGRSKWKAKR